MPTACIDIPAPVSQTNGVLGSRLKACPVCEEKHPSWLEIFFDVGVVIGCASIVHDFSHNIDIEPDLGLAFPPIFYIAKCIPILGIWNTLSLYYNRFGQAESFLGNLLCFFQFTIVAFIAMFVSVQSERFRGQQEQAGDGLRRSLSSYGFALCASHLIFAGFFILEAQGTTTAYWFSFNAAVVELFIVILWIVFALSILTADSLFPLYIAVLLALVELEKEEVLVQLRKVLYWFSASAARNYVYIPLDARLAHERYGLLVCIALGEIMGSIYAEDTTFRSYMVICLVVAQCFLFKYAYFDIFSASGDRVHALANEISKSRGVMHFRLTNLLVMAMLSSSIYLRTANVNGGDLEHDTDDDDDDDAISHVVFKQVIYAVSCALVLLACHFLGLTHEEFSYLVATQRVPVRVRTAFMVLAAASMVIAASVTQYNDSASLIAIVLLIFGTCLVVEFLCRFILLEHNRASSSKRSDIATTASILGKGEKPGGGALNQLESGSDLTDSTNEGTEMVVVLSATTEDSSSLAPDPTEKDPEMENYRQIISEHNPMHVADTGLATHIDKISDEKIDATTPCTSNSPRADGKDEVDKFKISLFEAPQITSHKVEVVDGEVKIVEQLEKRPIRIEGLFDLAVVYCVAVMVDRLSIGLEQADSSIAPWLPVLYLCQLIPVLRIWSILSFYYNRFGQIGSIADNVFTIALFLCVRWISAGLSIEVTKHNSYSAANGAHELLLSLNATFSFSHFVMFLVYLRVAILIPNAQGFALSTCLVEALLSLLWVLYALCGPYFYPLLVVAIILEVFEMEYPTLLVYSGKFVRRYISDRPISIPLNAPLLVQRHGLLVIIALGEVIAAAYAKNLKAVYFGVVSMMSVQGFLMKLAYFDVFDCMGQRAETIAPTRSTAAELWSLRLTHLLVGCILASVLFLIDASKQQEEGFVNAVRMRTLSEEEVSWTEISGNLVPKLNTGSLPRKLLGHHNGITTSSADNNQMVRQMVYACACAGVLLSCHFLGLCHKQFDHIQRMQIVPVHARNAYMLLSAAIMVVSAGVWKYENPLGLIFIIQGIFAPCLLVEYVSRWVLLRDDSLSDKAAAATTAVNYADNENANYSTTFDAVEAEDEDGNYDSSGKGKCPPSHDQFERSARTHEDDLAQDIAFVQNRNYFVENRKKDKEKEDVMCAPF